MRVASAPTRTRTLPKFKLSDSKGTSALLEIIPLTETRIGISTMLPQENNAFHFAVFHGNNSFSPYFPINGINKCLLQLLFLKIRRQNTHSIVHHIATSAAEPHRDTSHNMSTHSCRLLKVASNTRVSGFVGGSQTVERTHTGTRRTCKLHTEHPRGGNRTLQWGQ